MYIQATRLSLQILQPKKAALIEFKMKLNTKNIGSPQNYHKQYVCSTLDRVIKLKFKKIHFKEFSN